jgi:hypothetical protein
MFVFPRSRRRPRIVSKLLPESVPPADPLWCYAVLGEPEPGLLPRVVAEFARRGLVPARLDAVAVRDGLSIDVEVGDAQAAQHVAERLRGLVHVERVLMSTRIFAEEARA